MTRNDPDAKPKRGRPRFTLRTLLLLMLVLAATLSWFVSRTRLAIRQQSAVVHIRSRNGHATYDYQATGRGGAPTRPPSIVRRLVGDVVLDDVVRVSWHAPHGGDADMQVFTDLPKLEDLRLNNLKLTDAGLRPLANLRHLKRLDLWCTGLTDDALPHLSQLDALEKLDLRAPQITDAGLAHLRGLTNLRELKVRGTSVTAQGARRLRQALPGCKVLGVGK